MTLQVSLLPQPQQLNYTSGSYGVAGNSERLILLDAPEPSQLFTMGQSLQASLQQCGNLAATAYAISASASAPSTNFAIVLRLNSQNTVSAQGYKLTITENQILIDAADAAGIFYGVTTLIQIIRQNKDANNYLLPCLHIVDWPDFPVRGFMLDISRDKVPTMATLRTLIDKLASWKINQLQLYTEHTFAYLNHPEVWKNASPLSGQEILELDAYCKERFIELVPNQNSFGHLHRWLIHPRYAALSEVTDGFMTPWGYMEGPFSLNPTDPASFELVRSLYDELLPHFSSRQINVGCDETFDLGQGKSKQICEERGTHQVYLEFLEKISGDLKQRGYQVQFWGDIILEAPELIPEIPANIIALAWGYEADHPFELQSSLFEKSNIEFYVCPGTSSWCSLAGRTDNAIGNLRNAAEAGLKHGAKGYLITDWGDRGHWQPLPVSYLGIVAGAAYAWSLTSNKDLDLAEALNKHVFEDNTGIMGKLAYDLGNIYQLPGLARPNGSQLFWLLQYSPEQLKQSQQPSENLASNVSQPTSIPDTTFKQALAQIDSLMATIEQSSMAVADAELIKREFQLIASLMRLACWRGLSVQDLARFHSEQQGNIAAMLEEYQQVWLSRNRPGGLSDSLEKLKQL